jgi:hypothetical protein
MGGVLRGRCPSALKPNAMCVQVNVQWEEIPNNKIQANFRSTGQCMQRVQIIKPKDDQEGHMLRPPRPMKELGPGRAGYCSIAYKRHSG